MPSRPRFRIKCVNRTGYSAVHQKIRFIGGLNADGSAWKLSQEKAVDSSKGDCQWFDLLKWCGQRHLCKLQISRRNLQQWLIETHSRACNGQFLAVHSGFSAIAVQEEPEYKSFPGRRALGSLQCGSTRAVRSTQLRFLAVLCHRFFAASASL
jgi:hypothetical protein